jgi:hypothetical protein
MNNVVFNVDCYDFILMIDGEIFFNGFTYKNIFLFSHGLKINDDE